MKKRTVYECEVCEARYPKAALAKACEAAHANPEEIRIVHCHFAPISNLALPVSLRKKVPGAVTVRFGPGATEVATYHLIKVGP